MFLPVGFSFSSHIALLQGNTLQHLRAASGMSSRRSYSSPASLILKNTFDVFFYINFYIKSEVSRVSIFGYLAVGKLRKHFGNLSWVIQSRDFNPCYPFGKFPVFRPLLLGVADEEKSLEGEVNAGNHGSEKGII